MAQVSVGKLLPNLKVTLGNDSTEVESSEEKNYDNSEKNSDGSPNVEIVRSWMESLQNPKVYKNKSGGFTTGLDLISEENTELLSKRAERFGLEKDELSVAPNICSLYGSMGITIENRNSGKMKNMRLDALHMRGVNNLNTHEIFDYFMEYGPASVEWINDFSCNVVWLDEASCARAILGVSKPLSNQKEEPTHSAADLEVPSESSVSEEPSTETQDDSKVESSMEVDEEQSECDCSIPVPPGHWRLGIPHPKAKSILLRFATKDDKKLPGAEKRSDYYRRYGNPNYGGLKGLISSSRKRKIQAASNRRAIEVQGTQLPQITPVSEIPVQRVTQSRLPRMRMYADDEELRSRKFRSRETLRSSDRRASVHSRLGNKYTKDDLCHLGSRYQGDHPPRKREDDLGHLGSRYQSDHPPRKRDSDTDLRSKLRRIHGSHRSPLCQE